MYHSILAHAWLLSWLLHSGYWMLCNTHLPSVMLEHCSHPLKEWEYRPCCVWCIIRHHCIQVGAPPIIRWATGSEPLEWALAPNQPTWVSANGCCALSGWQQRAISLIGPPWHTLSDPSHCCYLEGNHSRRVYDAISWMRVLHYGQATVARLHVRSEE